MITTATFIFIIAVIWTLLSVLSVGVASYGVRVAKVEEAECKADLAYLEDLSITDSRHDTAKEEYRQAHRKRIVMQLFLAHQLLFLCVGCITLVAPAKPISDTITLYAFFRHLLPSVMFLAAQGMIVISQYLLTFNTYRRQLIHKSYGHREGHDD